MKGKHMYNGHKNWAHWNVSLWINNDEGLYRDALCHLKAAGGSRKRAARALLYALTNYAPRTPKTPDGARYSISAIYHAMDGMTA
jgi:hypothetical protein